jgi:putative membrane protein
MNLFIKGIIIGIGKILPGISGSMLAIMMGEYERIIESLTNIRGQIKEKNTYLLKIGIGIITSISLLSKVIVKCLNLYYFATMLLLIGMIVGNILGRVKQSTNKKERKIILVSAIIIIIIQIIEMKTSTTLDLKKLCTKEIRYTIKEFIILVGIGSLDAISSIIPGISGTALLMITGYYNNIIETISTIMNYKKIIINGFIMIPFGIGFIITLIIMAKAINTIIIKYNRESNIIITVLMTLTTFTLIKTIIMYKTTISEYIIGTITLLTGIIITDIINKRKKVN